MEKHKCKLCSKSFSNGRALGGHIRTHSALLPIPPPPLQKVQPTEATSALSSDEEQKDERATEEEEKVLAYGLRENPRKSFRLVDPAFLDVGSLPFLVQEKDSETESIKRPTRRKRSKRTQKLQTVQAVKQQVMKKPKLKKSSSTESVVESVSDTTSLSLEEEYVAWCLVMLSRDVWSGLKTEFWPSQRTKGKYQCEKCNKVFGSFQALGGHKTSHARKWKDNNASCQSEEHFCPICGKSFASGQALGGHKRSHSLVSSTNNASASVSDSASPKTKIGGSCLILDLNFPALAEENADTSALSAVYDAMFINPTSH